jgi:hypothetical protein
MRGRCNSGRSAYPGAPPYLRECRPSLLSRFAPVAGLFADDSTVMPDAFTAPSLQGVWAGVSNPVSSPDAKEVVGPHTQFAGVFPSSTHVTRHSSRSGGTEEDAVL